MIEIGRIAGQAGQHLQHCEVARLYKMADRKGEGGLQTDHAAGGLHKGLLFLVRCVRRVVGGDQVDRAVLEALDDGEPVSLGAEGRIDLGKGSFSDNSVFCQREMVGRRLRVDAGMRGSYLPHIVNTFRGADMLDTQRGIQRGRDLHVARDQCIFRLTGRSCEAERFRGFPAAVDAVLRDQALVLLVEADRKVQLPGFSKGRCEDFAVHDREPVVCKACSAAVGQRLQVAELLTGHAFGHIGTAVEVDGEIPAAGEYISQDIDGVDGRLGIGHEDDRGIPALNGRLRACLQVLFVGEAGIAEVGMGIDESRAGDHTARVDNGNAGGCQQVLLYFDKAAVVDQNIAPALCVRGGINEVTVVYEQHRSFSCLALYACNVSAR